MAKKLNDIYLKENKELETHKILVDSEKPPKKKKGSSSVWAKLRPLVAVVVSLAIVGGIVYGVINYVKGHYFDPVDVNDTASVEVTIPKGSSLSKISEILYDNELIQNKQVFKFYVDFSDMTSKLKAGTYQLSKNMDFDDLIYALQKGKSSASTARIQFIEGLGVTDYANVLVASGILKNTTEYLELAKTGESFVGYSFIADAVTKNAENGNGMLYVLEGYLFPDTYDFYTNASASDAIQKQLDRFNEILDMKAEGKEQTYRERAEEIGMTVHDAVTLASIIEKEAKAADFKKVSMVFHNRLDNEMRLDSDATLAYALGVKKLALTDAELDTDSPYNTRKIMGLPIGPICNPSKAALEAALYPDEGYEEYFYFTLKDPKTGEMVFAKTLEEHDENVSKYGHLYAQADAENATQADGE
ncbi:MAG: endolytic transglycosylase MltG [Christensenella sp.]|uniref:endolytic transglycosylase MltG n=1 Tax=Christensenella sp. TaxID=1935934 RepID=UPI002B1FE606|nr:endolytic transglycosylase MltG [Christensenella sp.]MEA5004423.1 endolytic transglycosylase MltG [Christensenella sp.]